ncbi:Hypothetical Protein FCC1311_073592 [Hondaea fermentalgiana]|uniref:Uncharacterized protein n=1 Tax=Hondaea fermentalgiana TaxID=2315210 RepID=A0A2R5GN29_9STRA|nr:Hypothetical Protein FCC1311_073592 [Hondaea fermentalgiana]|eukprot:GBG31138.1 Hypothetical Protein FCC1311_073592 [Hondaea fermentalgiana]
MASLQTPEHKEEVPPQASRQINNEPDPTQTATFLQDFSLRAAEKDVAKLGEMISSITPEQADVLVPVLDKLYRKDDVFDYDNIFHQTISSTNPLHATQTARLVFAAIRQGYTELANALVKDRNVDEKSFNEELKKLSSEKSMPDEAESKLQEFCKSNKLASSA